VLTTPAPERSTTVPVATALPTTSAAHLSGLLEAVLPEPSLRELLGRESFTVAWRDIARALRRREAQGLVRGGRFVSGIRPLCNGSSRSCQWDDA